MHRTFLTFARVLAVCLAAAASTAVARGGSRPAQPPARLADTGLSSPGVQAFAPQYPLWSDGAAKRRWVYLPPGSRIDVSDPAAWDFPVGTKFWKEFAFGGRKVETRFLWKSAPGEWTFASYAWNDAGTDAVLADERGIAGAAEVAPGKHHTIPAVVECRACHDSSRTEVLGFNALQLSTDRDPNAIHREPLEPGMVTLETLHRQRALAPARPEWITSPPRIQADTPATRAVLGYLSTNCGSCHNQKSTIAPLGLLLQQPPFAAPGSENPAIATTVHTRGTWTLPQAPDESARVKPGAPELSALLYRMRSRRPSSQMPPLGSVVADTKALEAVTAWIRTGT